jgi:rubrerythrin
LKYRNYFSPPKFNLSAAYIGHHGIKPSEVSTPDQWQNIYQYPQNAENALRLIQLAIAGESNDSVLYSFLLDNSPTPEDKELLTMIRDNELNHYKMFRQIYYDITGLKIPQVDIENFIPPENFCDGIKKALFGELNSLDNYSQILYGLENQDHINMLSYIMTDEIRHISIYNYLYAKYNCNN